MLCETFILGLFQNLVGYGPGQPALEDPALYKGLLCIHYLKQMLHVLIVLQEWASDLYFTAVFLKINAEDGQTYFLPLLSLLITVTPQKETFLTNLNRKYRCAQETTTNKSNVFFGRKQDNLRINNGFCLLKKGGESKMF